MGPFFGAAEWQKGGGNGSWGAGMWLADAMLQENLPAAVGWPWAETPTGGRHE